MKSTPRLDPDWEHWPGRPTAKGEDRVRSRLRALFVPAEAEDAITELQANGTQKALMQKNGIDPTLAIPVEVGR